jgi:hypothetical protein
VTQTPAPTEPFAQHVRLAEVVHGLRFQRYPLFLTGLVYEDPGGPLRRATAVATRRGDLVAFDRGEFFESAGRVPTSRLFDDDDFAERPERTRVAALADLNQAFFAREVAAWTEGHRSVNEIGIGLLRHWFAPNKPPATITRSEVLGVVPLEVTDALLDTLREVADRHERGFMVEQVMELLVES